MNDPTTQIRIIEQNTRWFRAAFNYSDIGFAIVGLNGHCIQVNEKLCEILGYSREELSSMRFEEFTHPDDVEEDAMNFEALIGGTIEHYKIHKRYYHKQGHTVFAHLAVTPVKDDSGDVLYFISQVIDQTLYKSSEAEIRISRNELQKIMDQSLDIIIKTSFDGIVLEINKACKRIWGYEPEELIGTKLRNLVVEADHEKTKQMRDLISENNKIIDGFENRFRKKDGTIAPMVWHMSSNLNERTILSIAHDSTEKKLAEEKVSQLNQELEKRAQELEISNKHLEQFAFVASHDLQEPLRMISTFLELLESKYTDKLDETAQRYIHIAVDGSKRMQKMILALLEYSVAGHGEQIDRNIKLNEVVEDALKVNEFSIIHSNASINYGELPIVAGYRNSLVQLFQNMISNSLKYQKKDTKPVIEIGCTETEMSWFISISDNGIGIEEKYNEKIFSLFQRLHNRKEYAGSGIGLSICKRIVEAHQGTITVASEVDKGTTFTFSISKFK